VPDMVAAATVAELVKALDLKSNGFSRAGSNPAGRAIILSHMFCLGWYVSRSTDGGPAFHLRAVSSLSHQRTCASEPCARQHAPVLVALCVQALAKAVLDNIEPCGCTLERAPAMLLAIAFRLPGGAPREMRIIRPGSQREASNEALRQGAGAVVCCLSTSRSISR
jgi:hypothetical protein